jgi:hypothetical protein
VQHRRALFDNQLTRMYMRKVYLEYRYTYDKSTTFRIDVNPDVPHGYLMRHQHGGEGAKISVGRIICSGCMLMLKMVITGVNVDSGNTHI